MIKDAAEQLKGTLHLDAHKRSGQGQESAEFRGGEEHPGAHCQKMSLEAFRAGKKPAAARGTFHLSVGCSGTAGAEGTAQDSSIHPQGPPDLNLPLVHHSWVAADHFHFRKGEEGGSKQTANPCCGASRADSLLQHGPDLSSTPSPGKRANNTRTRHLTAQILHFWHNSTIRIPPRGKWPGAAQRWGEAEQKSRIPPPQGTRCGTRLSRARKASRKC